MAEIGAGHKVLGCEGCGSTNPDRCIDTRKFVPIYTKEEVFAQFREELRNPQILLRDYRDVVFFMWVLGVPVDEKVDEKVLEKVEKREIKVELPHRVIHSSPDLPLEVPKTSIPSKEEKS
jgi:hypothetical protein